MTAGERLGARHQLSRNFRLGEFSGWQLAESPQLEQLERVVRTILQPIRDTFGAVVPTSWYAWSSGAPRTGAHGTGGAVDFVVPGTPLPVVWAWARSNLRVGEFIDERDHLHATLPGIGGQGEFLIEPIEGEYVAPGDAPGASWRPDSPWYELPGITATVSRYPGWLVALVAVAVVSALADRGDRRRVA